MELGEGVFRIEQGINIEIEVTKRSGNRDSTHKSYRKASHSRIDKYNCMSCKRSKYIVIMRRFMIYV